MYKYFVQNKRDDQLKHDEEVQLKFMNDRARVEAEKASREKEARSKVLLPIHFW